jgi:hypothetical protein
MLHGREYSKRILGVKPPMGRASGPSVCPTSLCAALPHTPSNLPQVARCQEGPTLGIPLPAPEP